METNMLTRKHSTWQLSLEFQGQGQSDHPEHGRNEPLRDTLYALAMQRRFPNLDISLKLRNGQAALGAGNPRSMSDQ